MIVKVVMLVELMVLTWAGWKVDMKDILRVALTDSWTAGMLVVLKAAMRVVLMGLILVGLLVY